MSIRGGTETIVWYIFSYQDPSMLGTNASTKKNISSATQQCRPFQEDEETAPQRLEPCVSFFYMGAPVKA